MKKQIVSVFTLMLAAGFVVIGGSVSAASNSLGITPRKDYTVKAGSKISDTLYVNNLSKTQPLLLDLKIIDFQAQDETGTPELNLKKDAPQTPWSLKPFIKLPSSITLEPGKSVQVPITVSIPAGQGAGSYYSAIEYVAQNTQQSQQLNLSASSASLVFVTVPGKATENLSLKQFGAYQPTSDGQSGSFGGVFFGAAPKELAFRVKNNGNVAEQPTGSVLVRNAFNKTVAEIKDVNPKKQLALRGQTRRFEICVKSVEQKVTGDNGQTINNLVCDNSHIWPGKYTATLDAFYGLPGSPQQEILATATFWYLPWWFLLIVLVIVALIVFGVMWVYRKVTGRKSSRRRH